MSSRPNLTRPINHQPTSAEVRQWREFAQAAAAVALGRSRNLSGLRRMAADVRLVRMFGPEGRFNVCVQLRELATEYAASAGAETLRDELARLADEVLKRCAAHDAVAKAERYG